jgi:hypothetical protein
MSGFTSIHIQPSYGKFTALVTWTTTHPADTEYHLFRSPDGVGDWTRVNVDPIEDTIYEDTSFKFSSRTEIPHYRLLAVLPGGEEIDSPIVGTFDTLRNKYEFAAVRHMMREEYQDAHVDGMAVLHYTELTKGVPAPDRNDVGHKLPSCGTENESYGRAFVGGFRPPLSTCIRPVDVGPIVKQTRNGGYGMFDQHKMMVRMLAYPRPQAGDLLVHVPTDNRWVITPIIKPAAFRGIFPVAYTAQVELLDREAPEYRVPLPDDLLELQNP